MKINNQKVKSLALLSLIGSTSAKQGNQSETNLNSLSQMGTNLTKRGDDSNQTLLLYAGYPISLTIQRFSSKWIKYCTASFMVVNTNSSNCNITFDGNYGNDYGGYLTTVFCWSLTRFKPLEAVFNQTVMSWDGFEHLGNLPNIQGPVSLHWYTNYKDIDYTYLSISDATGNWPNVKLIPYVVGDKEEFYPVIGLGSVTIGSKVCAYGAGSGYACGNLTEINAKLLFPYSWWGHDGLSDITFEGLGKVDLGASGFHTEEDLGGPVYVESNVGHQTTAQALGHITHFDNSDPNHKLLYYTPLDKALGRMSDNFNCTYSLLTYNKDNAQQYDQLIAQMEIPVKK